MGLPVRDTAVGEQHHDAHARPLIEGRGNRTAGVSRGSDEYRQRIRFIALQPREAGGKETGADVFERRSRSVIKLEEPGGARRGRPR